MKHINCVSFCFFCFKFSLCYYHYDLVIVLNYICRISLCVFNAAPHPLVPCSLAHCATCCSVSRQPSAIAAAPKSTAASAIPPKPASVSSCLCPSHHACCLLSLRCRQTTPVRHCISEHHSLSGRRRVPPSPPQLPPPPHVYSNSPSASEFVNIVESQVWASEDDGESMIICPTGYTLTGCWFEGEGLPFKGRRRRLRGSDTMLNLEHVDGAFLPTPNICVAVQGAGNPMRIRAVAACEDEALVGSDYVTQMEPADGSFALVNSSEPRVGFLPLPHQHLKGN